MIKNVAANGLEESALVSRELTDSRENYSRRDGEVRMLTIADAVEKVLRTETPKQRASTQDQHHRFLGEIRRELGHYHLTDFGIEQYYVWIAGFKTRKPKRKTFNDYTKFLNMVYHQAYNHRMVPFFTKFPKVDKPMVSAGRVYTKDEIERIFAAISGYREKLQFCMALEMYMRLREILNLKKDRVDLDRGYIQLLPEDVKTGTKTGIGRTIPISKNVIDMLRFWMDRHPEGDYVFPGARGADFSPDNKSMWSRIKTKAGIKGRARWHDIRHTALSIAVFERRVSLPHLAKVCGTSAKTLERVYLHADVEQLRDIVNVNSVDRFSTRRLLA